MTLAKAVATSTPGLYSPGRMTADSRRGGSLAEIGDLSV